MSREAAKTDEGGSQPLVAGRYRPLRPLGSGGSGSVWLARDEELGRDIALKVVRREGKAAARAEREVEAATRLRHPRCLRALALHRDDEHVYVAYEYVRGRTLRDALVGGVLDDAATVEAGAQILEGLAHAHSKKVVHRDVKPANVMLAEGSEPGVRILDFGLATLEEADTLTAAGDVPGTLAYVSPERLDGQEATGAADVWATGVVLWEALAGRHPFTSASPVETVHRIKDGAPPLATVRPDLPADLCALVDRMLTLDPRKRPSARRLGDALRETFEARSRRPRPVTSPATLEERAPHAALAALFVAGSTLMLPFFPGGWPFVLALAVAGVALRSPRLGFALALAAPVLPLGNVSTGIALAYAAAALGWFAFFARDPLAGMLFATGPLLAPLAFLGVVPVLALRASGQARRAATAAVACLAAATVAAIAGTPFPFDALPGTLALAETSSPFAAAGAVLGALSAQPALMVEAAVLAGATLCLPRAREHGLWGAAFWGTAVLAAATIGPVLAGVVTTPGALAPGIWAAALWVAWPALRPAPQAAAAV